MHVSPAAGLWSEGRGVIHTPRASQMFFLPQQPFMPLGTLRQQLLFPSGAFHAPGHMAVWLWLSRATTLLDPVLI